MSPYVATMKTEHKLLILHLPIFYWVICLRIIVIRVFFIHSGDKSFLRYMFYKYFLGVTCVFVFLMTFFSKQKVSILIKLMISFLILHFVLVSQQRNLSALHFLFLFYLSVHCSQAVLVDRTLYISGQLGMDPSSGQLVPGGVKEEAKQVGHFPHLMFSFLLLFNFEEY